jgi:hypothetical protein
MANRESEHLAMSRYRIRMKIRPTGERRLPKSPMTLGCVFIEPNDNGSACVTVEPIKAVSAQSAYDTAHVEVSRMLEYLPLLGSDMGFLITGLADVSGRNLDLHDRPIPANQPPPLFDCIGGVIPPEGQEAMGALYDLDGSKRRSGYVVVHHLSAIITPGAERVDAIKRLCDSRPVRPRRLELAMAVLHDAACASELSNAFAQTYTALEILIESNSFPTAVDIALSRSYLNGPEASRQKAKLRDALLATLKDHGVDGDARARIAEHAMNARSTSQIDLAMDYFEKLGISVARKDVQRWRSLRGGLVHAATDAGQYAEIMHEMRRLVANAILQELTNLSSQKEVILDNPI